jgi:hypothetical protein
MSLNPATWSKKVTISILITVAVLLIGWDIYVAISPPSGDTISEVILGFSRKHPVVGFAFGVLMGHLLWPQRIEKE